MRFLLALFLFTTAQLVVADCPSLAKGTIHWIVPSKPGGGYDAYSRLLQPFMEQQLNARIVIENRFEAGGIVAAMAIRDAPADGTTLGIINAPGLLTANMMAKGPAPNPETDFTVLGRVAGTHVVMFTGRDSGISTLAELMQTSRTQPILVGVRDAGSSNFITLPITASLIGMDYELVTGYTGNTARTMAALRSEIDIVFHNIDSARRYVEAEELIPLLQITDPSTRALNDVSRILLAGVPILAGNQGFAQRQAAVTGKAPEQAEEEAAALSRIFDAGRIVVAPRDLPESLASCLGSALTHVLHSDELLGAAKQAHLIIDYQNREAVLEGLSTATRELGQFEPLILSAIDRARR